MVRKRILDNFGQISGKMKRDQEGLSVQYFKTFGCYNNVEYEYWETIRIFFMFARPI